MRFYICFIIGIMFNYVLEKQSKGKLALGFSKNGRLWNYNISQHTSPCPSHVAWQQVSHRDGIAEPYAKAELVALAEAKLINQGAAYVIVGEEAHGAAKTDGADAHRPGGEHHVLGQKAAVVGAEVVAGVTGDEDHRGGSAKAAAYHVGRHVGVSLYHGVAHGIEEYGAVHYPNLPMTACFVRWGR